MEREGHAHPKPMPDEWGHQPGSTWPAGHAACDAQERAQQLQDTYQRLHVLATVTRQIFWTARPDGMFDDSPFWRAYTGRTRYDLRGLGWMDTIHPEDRERTQASWLQAVATRRFFETEYRIRRADGVYHPFLVRGVPLLDAEGHVREWVGVCTDISERKQLEEERLCLLEREQQARAEAAARASQLEATIEAMTEGVGIYTPEGYPLLTNRSGRTILGIDDPERFRFFTSRPHPERIALLNCRDKNWNPYPPERSPLTRALQGEVAPDAESEDMLITALDGHERYLSSTAAPIHDAQGQLVGAVFVYRDVTERRLLERRTHDALDALLEIAQTLVTPTCPKAYLFDEDAHPDMSAVAQRLAELIARVLGCGHVGIAAADPETTQLHRLAIVTPDPEERHRWWETQHHAPRLSESSDPTWVERLRAGEITLLDRHHPPWTEPHPFNLPTLLIVPMCVGNHLVGLLSIGHDNAQHVYTPQEIALAGAIAKLTALVIERDHLLQQREEAQASVLAIQEANRQLETFLGMASHELKTPLTSILMGQEMLQRRVQRLRHALAGETADTAGQMDAVQALANTTHQQAGRLNRLVNDLLDTSRIQAGRMTLHLTRADLGVIVRSAVEEQRQVAPERRLLLHVPSRGPLLVRADAERLGQVVTNYLTNALKYSDEARPVEVGVHREGEHARVWVRDQGPGIAESEQERIWERFHRVPGIEIQSGSGIGLGIGLHISKTIIDQHGGKVGVQSTRGAGATFWFTLPLTSTDERPVQSNG